MTFHVVRKSSMWSVDDPTHLVGGLFVDLASAIRFVRQLETAARIVVRDAPREE